MRFPLLHLPRSLQGRLLLMVIGGVAGIWIAAAALTWLDVRHELDELLDGHLAQAAALLVAQQAAETEEDEHGINAPSLHRYAPKVAFQVFHEGRLALRSANAPATPMLALAGSAEERPQEGFRTIAMGGATWRVFATYGRERDTQVFVGEQVESRNAILRAVLRSVLTPMLFALPLLALAAWWAVRQGVAPMQVLSRMLARRQAQALAPITVDGAPSEMAPMLAALNSLFQRIAELMASERRFTADAAHELRTPIAAIRAQAQVALASSDDAERTHALQATVQGCDRATRLVTQLLTLSRLEAGSSPVLGRLDACAVVREVVADVAALALDRQQTIEVEAQAACPVNADATLLAVLLRNLVDNAIRYSPAGARVRVVVRNLAGSVSVTVVDSGPGMSDAEMAHLGERFFRVVGTGQSGSGLGWSITRRIASVLAAELSVSRSALLGGLSVELRFPLA
ncbi:ATP-binding protein [Ideonella azotifigens]|uniref:histidine kinase n=1 Tax=Ideonella azotifigens TaxID=513160 RepID=A0ABN1K359_9BURK|nr:ATP-binding protein [Ideonella azotifigens]